MTFDGKVKKGEGNGVATGVYVRVDLLHAVINVLRVIVSSEENFYRDIFLDKVVYVLLCYLACKLECIKISGFPVTSKNTRTCSKTFHTRLT